MESRQKFEDLALRNSILPVFFYLLICFVVFFMVDQVSVKASNFLGADNVKLVSILEGVLISLLTTFLIFFLVYKYKFIEINAKRNMNTIVNSSPYPVFVVHLKDYALLSFSPQISTLLGFSVNELDVLNLRDIVSENAFKQLVELKENKHYINHDFKDMHFIDKSKAMLSFSANIMKYELLDEDYLLISLYAEKIVGSPTFEESESHSVHRSFKF